MANSPDTSETLNVEIKPFNTGTITLSKQKYSEKNVDYTVKSSSILSTNVTITETLTESSTSVVLSSALEENIPTGTTFKVGDDYWEVGLRLYNFEFSVSSYTNKFSRGR